MSDMAANPQVTARVPEEVVQRLDRLAAALTARQEPGERPAERTDVVRRLLMRALPEMEREFNVGPSPAPAAAPAKPTSEKGGKPAHKPKK
jgi:hypothetical protein